MVPNRQFLPLDAILYNHNNLQLTQKLQINNEESLVSTKNGRV